MYTRSFYPDTGDRINLPENYDGTAFPGKIEEQKESEPTVANITKAKDEGDSILAGHGKVPILSGLFGNGSPLSQLNLKLPTIGTEELLLIATAAFLFFSKDGDKESALLLLLLLLIN